MEIINPGLKFTKTLEIRKSTEGIILHHRAGDGTIVSMHEQHIKNNGYCGVGYNFYIRKDGKIYQGRGWDAVGAHAGESNNWNTKSIGICFEGNYNDTDTKMPEAQHKSGVWLIREAITRYGKLSIHGHRDVTATACPGKYFPFTKMKEDVYMPESIAGIGGTGADSFGTNFVSTTPSSWAKEAWEKACRTIAVPGADGKFIFDGTNPQGNLTREQLAVILWRLGVM